jgi:hypothetical protein
MRIVAQIDMIDVVATLNEKSPDVFDLLASSGDSLRSQTMQFMMTPVQDVMSVPVQAFSIDLALANSDGGAGSKRNRILLVPRTAALSYALLVVSEKVRASPFRSIRHSERCAQVKRVAIVDEANHIGYVFTQTSAVKQVAQHIDLLPADRAALTAGEIVRWAGAKPVITVRVRLPMSGRGAHSGVLPGTASVAADKGAVSDPREERQLAARGRRQRRGCWGGRC